MTVARYGLGLLLALATLAPLLIGAGALRRRLLPAWGGALALLVQLVLTLVGLILILQLLGLVGLLYAWSVALVSVAAGAAVTRMAPRLGARHAEPGNPPAPDPGLWPALAAVAGVAVVVADWCTRVLPALDNGMTGADTVWYHLPQAASFVQDGSITHVQFFETGAGTAFYPATSGLLHALGMLWFGNDFASVFMNLGWLGMALLAAWCLGRRYGQGPACVLGLCLLLATPIMVETQPGGAYNDLMGIALLLAAAALLVNGGPTGVAGVIAALAAAPALGTKLTMAVPLVALTLGVVVVTPTGRRVRTAAIWLGALLALGTLWYARNLFAFGNPVPAADLELGPLSLPSPPLTKLIFSPIHYVGTPGVLRGTFLPGLLDAYGPAWWALLGLAAVGMVAVAVSGRTRVERMLGVVAIVSAVAFLFTPQGLGTEDDPLFFKFNLRYPTPALALGLALLPLVPGAGSPGPAVGVARRVRGGAPGHSARPAIWPTELRTGRFALIANLQDPIGLLRRRHHPLAAGDIPRHHLLAQHVLARLEARHDDVRVRPERHRNDDRLDVLLLEHLLPLDVVRGRSLPAIREHLVGLRERGGIDVGHRLHLAERGIDAAKQRAALPADANEAQAHRTAPHGTLHRRCGAQRRERRRPGDRFEKVAPPDGALFRRQNHQRSPRASRFALPVLRVLCLLARPEPVEGRAVCAIRQAHHNVISQRRTHASRFGRSQVPEVFGSTTSHPAY